jgi:hypothetical protein
LASATGLGPVGRGFKSLCPEFSICSQKPDLQDTLDTLDKKTDGKSISFFIKRIKHIPFI